MKNILKQDHRNQPQQRPSEWEKPLDFSPTNSGRKTRPWLVVPSRRGDPSLCRFGAQTPLMSTSHNLACRRVCQGKKQHTLDSKSLTV